MNLKKSRQGHKGSFEERNENGDMLQLIFNLKN